MTVSHNYDILVLLTNIIHFLSAWIMNDYDLYILLLLRRLLAINMNS